MIFDDEGSAFMREFKRLLICDCETGKRDGKLVAIQRLQDSEEIINSILSTLYQKIPSDFNSVK